MREFVTQLQIDGGPVTLSCCTREEKVRVGVQKIEIERGLAKREICFKKKKTMSDSW